METWLIAVGRSLLIWTGMCILMNKKYKSYILCLYVVLTVLFRYYAYMFVGEFMRPMLFVNAFILSNIKKTGFGPDAMKNFFHLTLVFLIIIISKTWVILITSEFVDFGNYAPYISVLIEVVIALLLFALVRGLLKKLRITEAIEKIDSDYRLILTIGMGVILASYYAIRLLPYVLQFNCSGVLYMQAIYITVLSFITGGLIALYHAIVRKEMLLIRRNRSLDDVTEQLMSVESLLAQRQKKLEAIQVEYSNVENKFLEMENFEQLRRDFEHDQRDILVAIKGIVSGEDKEAIENIYERYAIKVENVTKYKVDCPEINRLKSADLRGIRELLFDKMNAADHAGVKFTVEVSETIYHMGVPVLDLAEILGIWINNALEEAIHTEKKRVHVSFIPDETLSGERTIEIRVSNSCRMNEQATSKESTKGKQRGRGLKIAEKIISNHGFLSTTNQVMNEKFVQLLEIKLIDQP